MKRYQVKVLGLNESEQYDGVVRATSLNSAITKGIEDAKFMKGIQEVSFVSATKIKEVKNG